MISLEVSIVSVIAVAAIISPVLTTLLNNRHLEKMKRIELEYELYKTHNLHKRTRYENFLKDVGVFANPSKMSDEKFENVAESYLLVFPYLPSNLYDHAQIVAKGLVNKEGTDEEINNSLRNHLIPYIRDQVSERPSL